MIDTLLLDTPLAETTFAFVDVETTGLHPHGGDRVCEVAVVRCVGDREVARFVSLINPGRPISPAAARVNGLADGQLYGQPTFTDVAPRVLALLRGAVFVAHNAAFDLRFLDTELVRLGHEPIRNPTVDTLELARSCYRLDSYGLGNLATRLGITVNGAHRALEDALTTRRLLAHLVRDLGAERLGDLTPSRGTLPAHVDLPSPMLQALRERRRLHLHYLSAEGPTERWVEPLGVTTRSHKLCLIAFCHLRQEHRTFRLDRIVAMRLDDEDDEGRGS